MKRTIAAVLFASMTTSASAADRAISRAQAVPSSDKLTLTSPNPVPINYEKYGTFEGVGTKNYKYVITDKKGLSDAAGEGVFPNQDAAKSPAYRELQKAGKLTGNHWTFVDSNNAALNFYKWATTNEDPGVKQFYAALMLERAGYIAEAVKALYAIAVHFPKTSSVTYYDTPWPVAPAALDRAVQLLRRHPEVKMELRDAKIDIEGKYDADVKNDVHTVNPGKLVAVKKRTPEKPVNLAKLKVTKTVGGPKFQLKRYSNGHWQFFVDGKPFPIKALTYSTTPVGLSPDRGTWDVSRDWQLVDTNKNGKHDGFDEAFVDKNLNNVQDADEPTVGDAKLIQDLGANTLRAYHHLYDKNLFRRLYKDHGIYVLAGDLLGVYAVGSGATWAEGTDYTNPKQQQAMLDSVRKMVTEYKDEPYILMWVLGNENIYGVANNSGKHPEAFFQMVNRAAELIHELDPSRPVAISNGDLLHMDIFQKHCPAVDVFGANVYRGEQGFGRHLYMNVRDVLDRPLLITEYGSSAYGEGYSKEQAEAYQAMYNANNWEDLEANMAGYGIGNALGGVLFEYVDEWWKANSDLPEKVQKARAAWYAPRSAIYKSLQPSNHDVVPQFGFPFLDGWSYEEWYGLAGQGDGKNSPFVRQLRKSYYTLQSIWRE